jgi:hypothetical protein
MEAGFFLFFETVDRHEHAEEVNGTNYPITSHDINDCDILLESRIEELNARDICLSIFDVGREFTLQS